MFKLFKKTALVIICFAMTAVSYAKDVTYDVVVVGSGAAGLGAALEAAEDGLSTVLIEKMANLGGSSLYIEGTFASGTPWQKAEYVGAAADPDEMFKQVMAYNHWRTNAKLARKWINYSAETLGWIHDHGVIIEEPRTLMMDGNRTWHILKDGKGIQFVKTMVNSIKKAGGDILTETTGKKLIMKDGKVTGIIAEDAEGEEIILRARGGVVIATGGFIDNKEMMEKYGIRKDYLIVGPKEGHDGEGMKMFESAGAKMDRNMGIHLSIGAWLPGKDPNTQLPHGSVYTQLTSILRQPYLWVDKHAKRFFDESQSNNWSFTDNALTLNGGMYYSVFDEDIKDYMMNVGIDVSHSDWARIGEKLNTLDEGIRIGQKEGYLYKANTLEELADKMGVDRKQFVATVERSNQQYDAGYDADFLKSRKYMKPIRKAPFYAIKGLAGTLITLSGPLTNENMQVISAATDEPISGLYVAGCATGGVYGMDYHLILEGAASSFALNSGRFASQHIAKVLKK